VEKKIIDILQEQLKVKETGHAYATLAEILMIKNSGTVKPVKR